MIHETQFIECSTVKKGGALFIVHKQSGFYDSPTDEFIDKLDAQYCCFQDCYSKSNYNTNNYGVCMYSAAKNSTLFYASSVNCSDVSPSKGAQFDLQAEHIESKYVNVTGGKAKSCGAIEYRRATSGFFRYQTMYKVECTWVTAFTFSNFTLQELTLEYSNYVSNTLGQFDDDKGLNAAFVFVKHTNIVFKYFYFAQTVFKDNPQVSLVTRDKTFNSLVVTLNNCFMDAFFDSYLNSYTTQSCHFNTYFTVYEIDQLNLGKCQGEKTPDALIITSIFTPSKYFSNSDAFSETDDFSNSQKFSNSISFTNSEKFSSSDDFSRSVSFTNSNIFSGTEHFSNSVSFTNSDKFSETDHFSNSIAFTRSNMFSASKDFIFSGKFSPSPKFSSSSKFSSSLMFSTSSIFSSSMKFSKSNQFTKSESFSSSLSFSASRGGIEILIDNQAQKEKKISAGAIAGISIASAALIALIGLLIAYINKNRKPNLYDNFAEPETVSEENAKAKYDNPIYNMKEDDPFVDDFGEVENVLHL